MKLEPLGDSAVVATLGEGIDPATVAAVQRLASAIAASNRPGIIDVVPAYATVTTFYDPAQFQGEGGPFEVASAFVASCTKRSKAAHARPRGLVEIPVCYGGAYGPDLPAVASHAGLNPAGVVLLHARADYLVCAIGFTPGFPYLEGLPKVLRTPRRSTPRAHVHAGSVAIGGSQTGVYPVESPGGWQIIGRTPLSLFKADREPPALLHSGDHVRFKSITAEEFESWK